jgi:hypothetical protein
VDVLIRLALGLALMALPGACLLAQTASEYEVKAAFLYRFASFVEWPPGSAHGPLCIGVAGQDPFGAALDEVVKGKSINGRAFVVKRFQTGQEPAGCHIVFISSSEKKKLRSILDRLHGEAVLTVGDMPGFCENGGVVNLELADDRVSFEINLDAAERARLRLSSKLLSLAKIIRVSRQ